MLSKKYKLKLRSHPLFFNKARRLKTPFSTWWYLHFDEMKSESAFACTQFVMVVPKKIARKATERNQYKRRVYAALTRCLTTDELQNLPFAVAITAHAGIHKQSDEDLYQQSLEVLLKLQGKYPGGK